MPVGDHVKDICCNFKISYNFEMKLSPQTQHKTNVTTAKQRKRLRLCIRSAFLLTLNVYLLSELKNF